MAQSSDTNSISASYTNSQAGMTAGSTQTSTAAGTMGDKIITGVFDSRHKAETAINNLRKQGFTQEEINIISKENGKRDGGEFTDDDITDGALTGGTIGGIGGLILGAGAMAIPGVGPIIAAGPIAAALSGAVAGGITGGLIDWGIPSETSERYERDIAGGSTLVVIRAKSNKIDKAAQILRQNGARDVESHNSRQ